MNKICPKLSTRCTNFMLKIEIWEGNEIFYSNSIEKTPESVRNKYQSKYEEKFWVWIAISPKGISKPCFRNSGLAINRYVYRDECLEPFLIPFIKKYHRDDSYVFWPDQAIAHYAKKVQDYLNTKEIPLVPKNLNSSNMA